MDKLLKGAANPSQAILSLTKFLRSKKTQRFNSHRYRPAMFAVERLMHFVCLRSACLPWRDYCTMLYVRGVQPLSQGQCSITWSFSLRSCGPTYDKCFHSVYHGTFFPGSAKKFLSTGKKPTPQYALQFFFLGALGLSYLGHLGRTPGFEGGGQPWWPHTRAEEWRARAGKKSRTLYQQIEARTGLQSWQGCVRMYCIDDDDWWIGWGGLWRRGTISRHDVSPSYCNYITLLQHRDVTQKQNMKSLLWCT